MRFVGFLPKEEPVVSDGQVQDLGRLQAGVHGAVLRNKRRRRASERRGTFLIPFTKRPSGTVSRHAASRGEEKRKPGLTAHRERRSRDTKRGVLSQPDMQCTRRPLSSRRTHNITVGGQEDTRKANAGQTTDSGNLW